MALFTDGSISTLDQLAAEDSAVLDVASTEGIDATAKLSLAQEEVGMELTAAIARSPFVNPSVWWPGSTITQPPLQLQQIVVTSPLRLWHTFRTLELVYRDAYYNQLNDRYQGKWNEYKDLAKWAAATLFQTGAGVVSDPIPIAQTPTLTVLSGTLPALMYFVQISWLNSRGEEGLASPVASINAPNQSTVQVSVSAWPTNAVAWSVYAGASVDSITLQNNTAWSPGQVWAAPSSGLISGAAPGTGQAPNFFQPIPRLLQRG